MNLTDTQRSDYAGPCPRCGGSVPNPVQPGAYPGALSRFDNTTYICSSCGTDEAMFQFLSRQPLPGFEGSLYPEVEVS